MQICISTIFNWYSKELNIDYINNLINNDVRKLIAQNKKDEIMRIVRSSSILKPLEKLIK